MYDDDIIIKKNVNFIASIKLVHFVLVTILSCFGRTMRRSLALGTSNSNTIGTSKVIGYDKHEILQNQRKIQIA